LLVFFTNKNLLLTPLLATILPALVGVLHQQELVTDSVVGNNLTSCYFMLCVNDFMLDIESIVVNQHQQRITSNQQPATTPMHRYLLIFLAMMILTSATPPKKKIIFFGDSITEAGVQPKGYISLLRGMTAADGKDYELMGAGIGGNKVYDLYLRLESDVLAHTPDVVVIWVGVNDVWHKRNFGTGTDADKFEKFYSALIRKIREKGAQVVLVTPAVVGERTDFSNELDGELNLYSNIIRKLARENNAPLVDLRQAFLDYIRQHNPDNRDQGILTYEGARPDASAFKIQATLIQKFKKMPNTRFGSRECAHVCTSSHTC
jgi:lysophospholipase L1-like esterase